MTTGAAAYLAMCIIAAVVFAITVAYGIGQTNDPK